MHCSVEKRSIKIFLGIRKTTCFKLKISFLERRRREGPPDREKDQLFQLLLIFVRLQLPKIIGF